MISVIFKLHADIKGSSYDAVLHSLAVNYPSSLDFRSHGLLQNGIQTIRFLIEIIFKTIPGI